MNGPVLLLILILLPLVSPARSVQGSISEPLQSGTGPVVLTFIEQGQASGDLRPDLAGRAEYHFFPSGAVFLIDTQRDNLTILPLAISALAQQNLTLPVLTFSHNSTTVIYSLSITILGNTINLTLVYSRVPGSENMSVNILGNSPILSAVLALSFNANRPLRLDGNELRAGHLGYAWDTTYSPSFNNATSTLSWSVPSSFNIDPIITDADTAVASSSAGTSNAVSLTTGLPNDLVIVWANLNGNNPLSTISDSAGLTWIQRSSTGFVSGIGFSYEFYAISKNVLFVVGGVIVGDNITVTATGSESGGVSIVAVAFNGANLGSPFDHGVTVPSLSSCSSCGSTSNENGTVTNTVTDTTIVSFLSQKFWNVRPTASSRLTLLTEASTLNEEVGVATLNPTSVGIQLGLSWTVAGIAPNNWEFGLEIVQTYFSITPQTGGGGGGGGGGPPPQIGVVPNPVALVASQPAQVQGILTGLGTLILIVLSAGVLAARRRNRGAF